MTNNADKLRRAASDISAVAVRLRFALHVAEVALVNALPQDDDEVSAIIDALQSIVPPSKVTRVCAALMDAATVSEAMADGRGQE